MPLVAATLALYAVPVTPVGSDVVVIVTLGTIVSKRLTEALTGVGLVESVTVMATLFVPDPVGVPVICPAVLILSPTGRPDATNVYGVVPPVAFTVAE